MIPLLYLALAVAPQTGFSASRAPLASPATLGHSGCEPRIAINHGNTPGDADSQFRITAPGSYYLEENLEGRNGKTCIEIASNDVHIDLMGFHMVGAAGSVHGITNDGPHSRIHVRDGMVTGFGESGIALIGSHGSTIARVTSSENGKDGLEIGRGGRVLACTTVSNGRTGITAYYSSLIRDCVSSQNVQNGIHAYNYSVVEQCVTEENQLNGLSLSGFASATGCTSVSNGGAGIRFSQGARLVGCQSHYNGAQGFEGIAGGKCHITDCTASYNGDFGFATKHGTHLRGNLATDNGSTGVGGGFRVYGWQSVVVDNIAVDNEYVGFQVTHQGNILRGNSCSESYLEWSVVAGNVCRVIEATTSGGIFGTSGGVSAGPYDPTLNYTY